jgi:iron complex outermembrane receptor protein
MNNCRRTLTTLFLIQFGLSFYAQNDSTKTLGEVHIKAIRANSQMATSSNTIKTSELQHLNLGQDIPTMIQQLPALQLSTDAGNGIGYSYLYIRGMDAQRIQVSINGVPYNDAESQEVYWVNIPDLFSSADDIQVQRGIGFSTMGGTGLGGSISIKTTKRHAKPFLQFQTSLGSFNTFRNSIQASTGVMADGWQITTRGSLIQSDGYIDRAWSRLGSFYLDVSKYGDKYSSNIIASHGREKTYQSWFGLSQEDYNTGERTKNIAGTDYESKAGEPYSNQIDNYHQTHLQWIQNFLWKNGHQSSLTGFFTRGLGFYEDYKVGQNYSNYGTGISGSGDLVRQLWLDNYLLGFNASHQIEKEKFNNTTAISFSNYSGDHFGRVPMFLNPVSGQTNDRFYDNAAKKTDLTAFNKFTYRFKKSHLIVDLQMRHVNYSTAGSLRNQSFISFDKNFLFFNPKIGYTLDINGKNKLYFFAGLSHREPVRSDFLDEDALSQPKPEKVYNLELGLENKVKNSLFKANLFGMYFIDQLVPTGNINTVGAPIRENVAKSYRAGLELEWTYNFSSKLSFYTNQYLATNKILNYSNYLIAYNESDYSINTSASEKVDFASTSIAFSPSWISYAELKYSPWSHTHLRLMNKIVSSQYLDNTSSLAKSIPLYSYTNVSLSHTIKLRGHQEIDFNLLLNNLLDEDYITRGYTYHSGHTVSPAGHITRGRDYNFFFPQAGFNFLLGVGWKI